LLRFSHLTNLFIYADPQYDEHEVIERFSQIVAASPFAGRLEMIGRGQHVGRQELGRGPRLPVGLEGELYEHEMTRRRNFGEIRQPWAREFNIRRKIGEIQRDLRLIYIASEGLATYSALFGEPTVNPQFLCTIQTAWGRAYVPDALEAAGGIHERFLLSIGGPRVWVRGNWIRGREEHLPRADGHWCRCVQKYAGWQCFNYENQPVFANVAAFARQDDDLGQATRAVISGSTEQGVHPRQRPLEAGELQDFDAAFVSPRLSERLQRRVASGFALHKHSDGSLPEVLDQIRNLAERHSYRRVVMTGRGYEDEGEYFREWIDACAWPEFLEVRVIHDLDLADQRGLASRDCRDSLTETNLLTSFNQ
ncbi:MAG: hypothetical protein RIC12_00275, partial [Pirellulales bacterium]